jgi:hypothetical protein
MNGARTLAHGSILFALLAACGDDSRASSGSGSSATITTITTIATDGPGSTSTAGSTGGGGTGSTSGPEPTTETPTTDATTTTTTTTTATTGDATTGGPGTTGGVDPSTTTTTTGAEGCSKVDFLFVVDNSVSMEGEQTELKAAFPEFIATIQNTLPASDYHVMVVDTDAAGRCSPQTCTHATCQEAGKYACMNIFTACDTTRGAGVVHPAGEFASNMPCDFEPGKRYLLSSDPMLTTNFQCAASVGTAGNASERPMDGMVEAVSPALLAPGGCNEGFLRDDAILVVTFISDDPNVEDQNSAQETYDAIVAAKNGDVDKIVMLGLIPGNGCGNGGQHWADMIAMFGASGIQGSICAMEFNTFFQDAVATILDACIINPG